VPADWDAARDAARDYVGVALYFSAVTFTATGYGDLVPAANTASRFLAASEGLIGVFLMATFIVCLARRYGRA
jgi:hypothetical protein